MGETSLTTSRNKKLKERLKGDFEEQRTNRQAKKGRNQGEKIFNRESLTHLPIGNTSPHLPTFQSSNFFCSYT
jgi:hypothetical protein